MSKHTSKPSLLSPDIRRLLKFLPRLKLAIPVLILLAAGISLTEVAFTALVKPLLDRSFMGGKADDVWLMPLAIVAIFLCRGAMTFTSGYLNQWLTQHALASLRTEMFAKLQRLPDTAFKQTNSANMLVKFTTDANNALANCADVIMIALRDGLLVIGLVAWLLYLNWKLSLIVIMVVPLTAYISRQFGKRLTAIARNTQDSNATLLQVVKESANAQRMVKLHGAQASETQRFTGVVAKLRKLAMRSTVASVATMPMTQIIASIGLGLVISIAISQSQTLSATGATAGAAVGSAALTVGGFVSFLMAMLQLLTPLKHLANLNQPYARTLAASASVFEFLDQSDESNLTHSASNSALGNIVLASTAPSIEFKAISLTYPNANVAALNAVSLTIPAGGSLTLVGRSGSGKSSLAALLPRFIEPSAGQVLLNGVSLTDYALPNLRQQIAMVTQEALLVDDTIAANVAFGDAAPDEPRIWQALEQANISELVRSLPDGLHSQIGEAGGRLSGGQKQRLTIARAFYKNAPILILDEATSALDLDSEAHIQNTLRSLMQSRTTLVITHRLSSIADTDNVALLEGGQLIELGTHRELMQRGGAYAALYDKGAQL